MKTPETQRDVQCRVLEGEGAYLAEGAEAAKDYKSPPEAAFPLTSREQHRPSAKPPTGVEQVPHPSGGTVCNTSCPRE